MVRINFLGAAALAFCVQPAFAQQQASVPATAPAAAQAAAEVIPSLAPPTQAVLRAQTPVILKLSEELTTKKKALRVGQRFNMEVAEAVQLNGVTVIPVGAPAVGEVTQVRNKGMWGKSGYINARVVQLRVGDRTIRLSGTFDDKGVTGTGGVVAAVAFVPIAGFFTTGTSALIPLGSQIKAFLDEDVPLAMAAAEVAPMTVAVPTQAAASASTPAPASTAPAAPQN